MSDPRTDFFSSGSDASTPQDARTAFFTSGPEETAPEPSIASEMGRQAGLMGRAMIQGVAALPGMVADFGHGVYELATSPEARAATLEAAKHPSQWLTPPADAPTQQFSKALTSLGFPEPQTAGEKVAGIVESGLTGAAMPSIPVPKGAPANFTSAQDLATQQRLAAVQNGMKEGYKVTPATTNPTALNKTLETVSGKVATQQAASAANQKVTNALASRALGLDTNLPITEGALNAIRSEAAQDYQAVSKAGAISMDDAFKNHIGTIVSQFNKTAQELPSLANRDLEPVANDLLSKESFSADGLLGAIKGLRNKADMAFRAGDGSAGSAYRQMASAVEGAIDRDLSGRGPEYKGLVDSFRSARQRIAMSHTVEDALNPGTGNVQASKLGAALRRGEPLSGELRTIGEFANALPKAIQEPTSSAISHLDMAIPMLSAAGEAVTHGVGPATAATAAAYPTARAAAKYYLLGPGQASALPKAPQALTQVPTWLKAAPATLSGMVSPSGEVAQ